MMKQFIFLLLFALALQGLAGAQQTAPTQTEPTQTMPTGPQVDEKADQLLHKMSDFLAGEKTFTFRTKEVHDKVRSSGKIVQAQVTREVAVRRPDGVSMHVISKAPDKNRELKVWYDGKVILLQSDLEKVYARTKMPPTIDEAFDYIGTTLNVPTPMGDILYSSPYDSFMSDDTTGGYVDLDKVEGKSCHHLAFENPIVDWAIWISDGEKPLPCKFGITYKSDIGAPQISITFLDWNFAPQLAENQFTHEPPADYKKIQIVGRVPMEEEKPAGENPQTKENQQ
ncbi:MAG TPA: DUF2092 domain-containing protein [Acidobacteriota bacterium]|nr:DUF2092 domain-containing protein [Acidobacteriota bacterium]